MENLWSPWRSEYIKSASDADPAKQPERSSCFLCAAANATEPDKDNLLVAKNEHVLVVMNKFPYNAGHVLIAPLEHVGELDRLNSSVAHAVMEMLQRACTVIQATLHSHGMNIGCNLGRSAGAGVPDHLHFHIVPRWTGDTNFMPVLAEVKVVSESMEAMWLDLRAAFAQTKQ